MLYLLLAALAAAVAVLVVRTLRFTPKALEPVPDVPVSVNEEKIVRDMQDMIRCKTVSSRDESQMDFAEFKKFQNLLLVKTYNSN